MERIEGRGVGRKRGGGQCVNEAGSREEGRRRGKTEGKNGRAGERTKGGKGKCIKNG